ncbi:uncharacterized protein VSU04_009390 isoform 5-T5 [Chlamydotis macqueenii]
MRPRRDRRCRAHPTGPDPTGSAALGAPDMTASSRSGMPWEGLGRLHLSKERSQRVQKGLFKLEGPNLLLRWPQKGGSFGS